MRPNRKTTEYLRSLKGLTLDERVKSRLRDELDAYVDLHQIATPVPARPGVRSPYVFSFFRAGYGVLAVLFVLLITGTGAAYASEGSVPGSPLYPLKVSVIEPVQSALIASPQGQAAWHAQLATRRLDEATKLAAAHKLDASTQTYLQDQFVAQVNVANKAADELAVAGKTSDALDARSDLEARITAHAELLSLLSDHLSATASTTSPTDITAQETRTLLAVVQQHRYEVMASRLALEDTADTDPTATAATLARAEASAQTVVDQASNRPSTEPIAVRISAAQSALTVARGAATAPRATEAAHESERASEEASILLKHASLLRVIAPALGTTTASTTASTTVPAAHATSTPAISNDIDLH